MRNAKAAVHWINSADPSALCPTTAINLHASAAYEAVLNPGLPNKLRNSALQIPFYHIKAYDYGRTDNFHNARKKRNHQMQILRAMSAEAKLGALALLTALALVSPSLTDHTSQTIVNPYEARVVIHNDSGGGDPLYAQVGFKRRMETHHGEQRMFHWHAYKLDPDDCAPVTYIRFHNAAGGYAENKLKFGKFCSGPQGEIDNSTHYEFAFDGGSRLDLDKK